MSNYRYGAYDDGPDPLAPPYDVREALDEMGERILAGDNPRDALRDLLRRGWQDRRGLDDLMRRVRERQRELRNAGRLDGMLDQARELLDEALEAERGALFPDPSDDARLREAGARRAAERHLTGHPPARGLRLAVARGAAEVRGTARPAAPGGARQPVPRHEAGAREPRPRGHAAGQGHARGPAPDARRRHARRAHAAGLRQLHGAVRRHVP